MKPRPVPVTIVIGLAVTAASCCLGARTIGRLRSVPAPEWTADLRTQGFKVEGPGGPGAYQANRQIALGSVGELVVLNSRAHDDLAPGCPPSRPAPG